MDSDDDILEVVEVKKPIKKELPQKIRRHKEMLRLAQQQAKKRRLDDQNYLAYRIEERKRKKQLRKEVKRSKNEQESQAEGNDDPESFHKVIIGIIKVRMHRKPMTCPMNQKITFFLKKN